MCIATAFREEPAQETTIELDEIGRGVYVDMRSDEMLDTPDTYEIKNG